MSGFLPCSKQRFISRAILSSVAFTISIYSPKLNWGCKRNAYKLYDAGINIYVKSVIIDL